MLTAIISDCNDNDYNIGGNNDIGNDDHSFSQSFQCRSGPRYLLHFDSLTTSEVVFMLAKMKAGFKQLI